MKVLLVASLLSFLFVANARISDEVLSCRWDVFKGDITALYINIDEPKAPRQEMIDRFCSQLRKYEECVANVEAEQLTVELMQGMCEYGFDVVYNNITCLQKAVNRIKSTCLPRHGDCASSTEWFRCSEMVTRDLCGETLAFIMEVLQPLYCEITEALQSDQPIPYALVPFHGKMDSIEIDGDIYQDAKAENKADSSAKETEKRKTTMAHPKTPTRPKTSHRTPKTSPRTPKTSPRTPKTSHRTPKTSHRTPKTSPRTPKTSHRTPKTSHRTPKTSHRTPKTSHRTPKTSSHPKTSIRPKTTTKPKPETSKRPKPPTTTKPKPTTDSGKSKLTSSGNLVLSVVVATLLVKNF